MKFLAAPAFLVTICCLTTTAQAADITIKKTRDGVIITITGEIKVGDDKKFAALPLSQNSGTIVRLDSPGGFNTPAALIGYQMRRHNHEVYIDSNGICELACTLIFFGAPYRAMAPDTQLGFHSAAPPTGPLVRYNAGNAQVANYLRLMGAPEQIIALQPKADPTDMNYVSYEQAQQLGILRFSPKTEAKVRKLRDFLDSFGPATKGSQ